MSERTADAGRRIARRIYAPMGRRTESDAIDPIFERPQKVEVTRMKIEVVSLDSTGMAISFAGPTLAEMDQPIPHLPG